MISNTLKINAIILFAVALAASGGALIKQKTKIVDNYTNLKSNPLLSDVTKYPVLKFHPHSEHYIYNFNTIENTDKPEFKALASKLSQLPSNFPSEITLTTVPAPSVASSKVLNPGELLSDRELYLISKYWLQLLPHFNSELLKCLAGPTEKPTKKGDQFANNCPIEIRYLKQNTTASSSTIKITNPSFNIPYTLYSKLQKCSNSKCQGSKPENCYCTEKSCSNANSCKRFDISELTIGPRFFKPQFPSKFSYPSPSSNPYKTFNSTNPSSSSSGRQNFLRLPHFSFPLPHSSHIPSKTQNSVSSSEKSLQTPRHWPQQIEIRTNWNLELNKQDVSASNIKSLSALVSKLVASPSSFNTLTNSPSQLFFVRYLATLYALLWSYSPNSLPLFPTDYKTDTLSEFEIPSSSNSPLFNIHELSPNPITSQK